MSLDDAVLLSTVGYIAAVVLGVILWVLVWYWIIRMAVTHAIRRTDEEREARTRQQTRVSVTR